MRRVHVIGGAGIDYTVVAATLPCAGETVTGRRFLSDCGGKGFNQAVAAARLGAPVSLTAAIGDDDAGDDVVQALTADGVNAEGLVRVPGASTARTLITVDDQGRKQTTAYPGANHAFGERDLPREAFTNGTVILAQLEISAEIVLSAARMARAARVPFILDIAPAKDFFDPLLQFADIVSMNADEARAISGVDVRDRSSAFDAVRVIEDRGAARIAVAAPQGRAIAGDGKTDWLENYDVDVIDTTGAGDAFAAGVAVALAEGQAFAEACRFGHAAAALAVTVFGARPSLPARAAVEALARQPR